MSIVGTRNEKAIRRPGDGANEGHEKVERIEADGGHTEISPPLRFLSATTTTSCSRGVRLTAGLDGVVSAILDKDQWKSLRDLRITGICRKL